jgi:lipoate-protein ligase A
MFSCRLMIDEPAAGAWNMAVDEALLESAASDGICTLRFYGWSEPTLSLGYFQRQTDRQQHAASLDCPLVRRLSGGGAILHDDELTYSFAAPATFRGSAHAQSLYDAFHLSLVEVLSGWGVQARLWEQSSELPADEEPFLCFQRRAVGDVVLDDPQTGSFKVAGSAQRRRRGAVLQHGSLLLRASRVAPELPGLERVMEVERFSQRECRGAWSKALAGRLELNLTAGGLSPRETAQARTMKSDKYDSASWNERK